jgi:zinc protease
MGHLLGAIDQAKLDEQREVVQNEKRQFENQPYAVSYQLITENTFPAGHPYSWSVIGSMEDLDAASLEDVQEWFKTYYGAANAVIVIAGDIDPQVAKEKVEKYFGEIPAGPPVASHLRWIAKRRGAHRQTVQDRVPQARIYKVWNVPEWGSVDGDLLEIAGNILASGKTSRFFKRLVYEDQIATSVDVDLDLREIAGLFTIEATAKPEVPLAEVEKALDEELARLLAEGPSEEELQRAKTQHLAGFIRGIERIGGFGGKSDILATSQVYGGSPDAYKRRLKNIAAATAESLKATVNQWLSDGVYILEVHPFPEYQTSTEAADRSKMPEPGPPPDLDLPPFQRTTLSNGLEVILAERHQIPVVNFRLLVDAGYAADQFARPGTAKLAMDMLDEGTDTLSSLEISDRLDGLGARLSSGSNLDLSVVSLSALKVNLDGSLKIYADVILHPSFPEAEFKRLQAQLQATIQREKAQPFQMALRVFPALLYGKDHAYGAPFTGSGTNASVASISIEDLKGFHNTWFKPENATLVVVGDTTLGEITPKLNALFSGWEKGKVPKKNIGEVSHREKSAVYLIDKPGSIQSVILAGHIAPPKANEQEIANETMNAALGGMFISRLNMNLREDKHWSYGVASILVGARGQRPFIVFAPVQSDKTKESMAELDRELRDITGPRPLSAEELAKAQSNLTLKLPGSQETMNAVARSITDIVRYGLPDDYYQTYPGKVRDLTTDDVAEAAKTIVHPDNLVWVVVGDRAKIEESIKELGLGEIHYIDAK